MRLAVYVNCPDCDAPLQTIPAGGIEYRRCPWVPGLNWWTKAVGLLVQCRRPYKRGTWA